MDEYTYEKTKDGYILYFPELLNVRMPKKQYLGPDVEPVTLTGQMMDDLCNKLNTGEIKVTIEDIDILSNRFRLSVEDKGKLEKIFKGE